ncbi:MAG: hypothetical protein IN818_04135 [Cutibacterium sp.]|nr:hypothetical protein [Cutibacterium sp.]
MNNAPYGKTIENVARRSDIRLSNDMPKAQRLAEKPHCIDWRAFDEQLVGVEMRKVRSNINKPFQHGFCVLEWSKLKMYSFYALLKDHFGAKVRLLYTDTDSFILHLFVDDLKQALAENPAIRNELDFGSVPVDHPSGLGDPDDPNAGVVGKFKEELNLDPIVQFVGLRPKMYSIQTCKATKWEPASAAEPVLRHKEVAKGCSRTNIRRFTPDDYVRMYRGGDTHVIVNRRIGSKLHQVLNRNLIRIFELYDSC